MISVLRLYGRCEVGHPARIGLLFTHLAALKGRRRARARIAEQTTQVVAVAEASPMGLCLAQPKDGCARHSRPVNYLFLEPNRDEKPDLDCSEFCCTLSCPRMACQPM